MTPEQTLDWLAEQHFEQCREARPVQEWIRSMKSMLPAQEPSAIPIGYWHYGTGAFFKGAYLTPAQEQMRKSGTIKRVYTAPQQRPWVGLTDAEAQWIYDNCRTPAGMMDMVEAKLKEKNERQ